MAILFSISTNDFDWIYFFDFDKGQGTTQYRVQDKADVYKRQVYIQANSNYCFVPVNGGKNILVLRGGNEFAAKLEKVK